MKINMSGIKPDSKMEREYMERMLCLVVAIDDGEEHTIKLVREPGSSKRYLEIDANRYETVRTDYIGPGFVMELRTDKKAENFRNKAKARIMYKRVQEGIEDYIISDEDIAKEIEEYEKVKQHTSEKTEAQREIEEYEARKIRSKQDKELEREIQIFLRGNKTEEDFENIKNKIIAHEDRKHINDPFYACTVVKVMGTC